ncbi:MAG: 1-(5-phosphoribosyl)-5-[(5-phosphoribosylamino)methylideneamino]imidazole-4-carboxamide isomerase [Candidatus Melainabacteria bacterium]|jgi:phosphoribosylformimino-5-aminoimidazole carboxamide ribotide isomerase
MIELIPSIDLLDGRVVRLQEGDYNKITDYGSPSEWSKYWLDQGAHKIHVVDLNGAKEGKLVNIQGLEQILSTGIQVQFGGGIRSWETLEDLFELGVRLAILGTAAIKEPDLMIRALKVYTTRIILALDARGDKVSVGGWLENSEVTTEELLKQLEQFGLNRFIYTDISRDGMMQGPNISGAIKLCQAFPGMQCILSGGVSTLDDLTSVRSQAAEAANLDGIISGKALYEKKFLFAEGQSLLK